MCTCTKREREREREREAGRLGTGRLGALDSLGLSISFRALSTAALLIGNLHY